MPYQPNIPTGLVNLDEDYLNLQGNFQQLDTSFGIDHLPFSNNTAQNGYHTSIHLVPSSTYPPTPPTQTSGFGQVFSATINDGVTTDQQLFYESGNGVVSQLTGSTVGSGNGYVFLPGGIIFQWGFVAGNLKSPSTGTVTFATNNIAFPNNCFNISTTCATSNGGEPNNQCTVSVNIISKTQFWWSSITTSSQQTGFYWTAIGN